MNEIQKKAIIESGKQYFRSTIIPNHLKKLQKLQLKDINVNPFLISYLAAFLCHDTDPVSLAKALVYPRILETCLSSSLGLYTQNFLYSLEENIGRVSSIDGIDFEFVDTLDGRNKFCIFDSKIDSVEELTEILEKSKKAILEIDKEHWYDLMDDVIICVPFGNERELSAEMRMVSTIHPVLSGVDFWCHLTGDKNFYNSLLIEFCKIMDAEHLCAELLNEVVNSLKTTNS